MSRQINQKKEAFLASVGPWSAGIAVPYAGVSPISVYIPQAHHLNSPVTQQHPGRARAARICVNLRHYKILHSVPAPVFSACGQTAGVITPENYAPFKTGSEIRLHIFRVGAAGPINLRPVFNTPYPKKDETHSSSSQFIRLWLVAFLGKGGGVPYSRCPFSDAHAASAYSTSGVKHRDGLALKSGNSSTDGVNVIPAVPFFDFSTNTIYAAVIRPVQAYGNSDEKDGLYDSAETFAPRFGSTSQKTAAQLLTDAVSPHASIRTYSHYQVTGTASVFHAYTRTAHVLLESDTPHPSPFTLNTPALCPKRPTSPAIS